MKNNNPCPKCASVQSVRIHGWKSAFGAGSYLRINFFRTVPLERVVCLACGFCEENVSAYGLEKMRKTFGYVSSL